MQDLRLAIRSLRATPLVTLVAALSLALAIGANTAIFSLVNSLLLRTLPVQDPAQLVFLTNSATPERARAWSYAVWDQVRQRPQLFEAAAAWSSVRFNLASAGEMQSVDGVWASGSFFDSLGVRPILGRSFSQVDDRRGGGPDGSVAVISYQFWHRHFGGGADTVGRSLRLNGVPFTIIGVTPPEFFGIEVGRTFDVIVPLGNEPLIRGRDTNLDSPSTSFLTVMGRLRPTQSVETAAAALRGAQADIRQMTMPQDLRRSGEQAVDRYLKEPFALVPAATGTSMLRERYDRPLRAMMVVVSLVLLIACVNIANLLLARAYARRHELSVRLALGASRRRLVRQLFTETAVLSTAGGALGLVIAQWSSVVLVRQLSTPTTTVFLDLSIDGRILAFTAATTVLTTVLFGTAPALRASRTTPANSLKEEGRTLAGEPRDAFGGWLIVTQVALSVVLLVAAGLFIRTFTSVASSELGFQPDPVLVVGVDAQRASADAAERVALHERLRDSVRALPDVADAALSNIIPLTGAGSDPPIEISGVVASDTPIREAGNRISPGWFSTLGIRLVAGRDFNDSDRRGRPRVAVVNEAFARKFFRGGNPLGRSFTLFPRSPRALGPFEIVGVAADSVYYSVRAPMPPTWYAPIAQFDPVDFTLTSASLSVRARSGSPMALTKSIVAAAASVNPELALTFRPLADQVEASTNQERLIALLAGFFGGLAMLLTALGLYGVTAYSVTRRRAEIGVRMALGARPARVIRLVLSRVSLLVSAGVVIGAGFSVWASRFIAALLYGVEPHDGVTLAGAVLALAAVAACAGGMPAWRASRLDPARVLRES
jgi:predicted permease